MFADKIGSFGLIAGGDLKFGSPEFQYLELVIILASIQAAEIPFCVQDELCISQVGGIREGKSEIKAS